MTRTHAAFHEKVPEQCQQHRQHLPEELETTSKSRTDGVGTEAKVCSMGIQR